MPSRLRLEDVLERVDPARLRVKNPSGVPVTLFANAEILIETEAVEELLGFVSLAEMVREIREAEGAARIPPFWGEAQGELRQVVVTPDFHNGAGVPIGTVAETRDFVVPAAVDNDVCCEMRLLVTDVSRAALEPHLAALMPRLRALFFQGQRNIPMSPRQREALLREGLRGVHDTASENLGQGLWRDYDPVEQERDLARVHFQGRLPARRLFAFADYVRGSGASDGRDALIGSVGGGNHFVEIQAVEEILDGTTAYAWGVTRDAIAIMVHSGSVGLGHTVGGHFRDQARALYPRGLPRPEHGFYVLPTAGPHRAEAAAYLDAMRNAANFAFANRLFLGLMALRALSDVLGRPVQSRLIYDAPHNLVWEPEQEEGTYLHRKGACPAPGPAPETAGPFRYTGHPVIIPGSMGAASFLLAGEGNAASLCSACHGAGRSLSRGRAVHVDEETYTRALAPLRIVTPVDPEAPDVRGRRDILSGYHLRLKEEAPYAYKPITAVIQTVEDAAIARRVARLWPLITVKG